jgi:hypothetical protein
VSANVCGGSPLKGAKNALGEVNGIPANEATILKGTFPVDRFLYNAYSNGSNVNIPKANAATINYVSEIGFICNPNRGKSTAAVDSITGATYISEIQSIISNAGFFPLSAGAPTGTVNQTEIDEGKVGNPGSGLIGSAYAPFDTFASASNSDPMGFCLTTTTDGNANS